MIALQGACVPMSRSWRKAVFVKPLVALFWVVFLAAAVGLLGKTVPGSRAAIHRVAGYLRLGPVAERFLPLEEDHHGGEGHHHEEDEEHHHEESSPPAGFAKEITLSGAAQRNFQIDDSAITAVELSDYHRTFSLPGVLCERPGHTFIDVPSPVSGVVTRVCHEEGEVVCPGEPLFEILLNRQEMIQAQGEYLSSLKANEINHSEIERLSALDAGIVPQKKRELAYENQRLGVEIVNQRRTLELMGLPAARIDSDLEQRREIIQSISVLVPEIPHEGSPDPDTEQIVTMDELNVCVGQNVTVGEALCHLTNLGSLVIKGRAFEEDRDRLETALKSRYEVTAIFGGNNSREVVSGLWIRSIENRVDADSGALSCCIDLANRGDVYRAGDLSGNTDDQRRYVTWHFQKGELCELRIRYDLIPNCIVLPADAVASDVGETCVFEWVGSENDQKIWRRTPVHLLEKTKDTAVIAHDGSIFPGALVTVKGAELLLSALTARNQKAAGGGGVQHGDHVH